MLIPLPIVAFKMETGLEPKRKIKDAYSSGPGWEDGGPGPS